MKLVLFEQLVPRRSFERKDDAEEAGEEEEIE